MKNYKVKAFPFKLLATAVAITSVSTIAGVVTYQVKKGDTLSNILYDHGLTSLYGENGFVKLTAILNGNKIKKNGDFVRVGAIIKLPIQDPVQKSLEVEKKVAIIEPIPKKNEDIIKESRAPSDEFPYSHFVYSPHLSFLKVDSANDVNFGGSNVSALSQNGFGVDLAWHIFYDDRFSFFGFGSLNYLSFYNDPNYTFNKTSSTQLHFGVGANFEYSPELRFTSKLSLRNVTFLDVITPTSINLESISVPEIEMGFEKTLFKKKKLSAKWSAHLAGLLPSSRGSYKSKLGYGAGTGF